MPTFLASVNPRSTIVIGTSFEISRSIPRLETSVREPACSEASVHFDQQRASRVPRPGPRDSSVSAMGCEVGYKKCDVGKTCSLCWTPGGSGLPARMSLSRLVSPWIRGRFQTLVAFSNVTPRFIKMVLFLKLTFVPRAVAVSRLTPRSLIASGSLGRLLRTKVRNSKRVSFLLKDLKKGISHTLISDARLRPSRQKFLKETSMKVFISWRAMTFFRKRPSGVKRGSVRFR
jgi:hypothetical protein